MVTATFRFYAELNDFLLPARRGREFSVPCSRSATVKHMIEALGVPHTEVALVLVNGEPARFDRLLLDAERVAVYPHFAAFDLTRVSHVQPPPLKEFRFVADSHLGGLARLLRMAGFDTLYRNDYRDREIAGIAVNESRILLSRDRDLLMYRELIHGCFIHAEKPPQQFREIIRRLNLGHLLRPFTLCLECNAPLRHIDKRDVLERLPPSVRVLQSRFSICEVCGRIFWEGSHWRRMRAWLDSVIRE